MPPKSSGSPNRRTGIRGITLATNFSLAMMPAVISLLIQPGRMALAVTPVTREFNAERADQRVDRGLGVRLMLVARGAKQRGEARGRNQPAERIARSRAFGHVPRRRLEHMEYAVQIGRQNFAPLLLGAVDEGAPSAAADAGIGEAAVDPAEPVERGLHRGFHRSGIGDVANPCIDLAGPGRHGGSGAFVLFRVAAPDRDIAAT